MGVLGGQNAVLSPVVLSRIQSEGFELLAPFCRSITKSFDSNAAWQTPFDAARTRSGAKKASEIVMLT